MANISGLYAHETRQVSPHPKMLDWTASIWLMGEEWGSDKNIELLKRVFYDTGLVFLKTLLVLKDD